MKMSGARVLFILSILFAVFFSSSSVYAADYRNAYMIMWDGTACDNLAYAKSMGYDYVGYQYGMENCMSDINMYFYLESPDQRLKLISDYIYLDKSYSDAEKKERNDFLLWKSNASFPKNIATGWFFNSNYFRPLPDFQQQSVINSVVTESLNLIKSTEDSSKKFYFGGWAWDVPSINGDLWNGLQSDSGLQVDIDDWTGTCSGVKHPNTNQDYKCYADGRAAFYKKLFADTKNQYPNMKVVMEPYNPWNDYVSEIASRYDLSQLKPDLLCEEYGGNEFVTDTRLFASGLMTKDKMCSSTPNVYDHKGNLVIAGNAGVNGAWFIWFGRLGGTGNFPSTSSIRQIPDRLKLIRAMPGWDNLNGVPLKNRKWDSAKLEYNSTLSRANMNIIYSVHPKNKKTYVVFLNKSAGFNMGGKVLESVYSVDELFSQKANASGDFTQTNGALYLKSDSNIGKGYIITLKSATTPPVNTSVAFCSDSDGNNTFKKGNTYGTYSTGSKYNFTDSCVTAGSVSKVREFYCSGVWLKEGNYTCAYGCSNGACLSAPVNKSNTTIVAFCSDSDGNNTFKKGNTYGTYSTGSKYNFTDSCVTAGSVSKVREFYCSGVWLKEGNYTCAYGCSNGACLSAPKNTSSQTNTTTQPPADTDASSSSSGSSKKSSGGGGGSFSVKCGDNRCTEGAENCSTCSFDCGNCVISLYCGDGVCTHEKEDCLSCSDDCGNCRDINASESFNEGVFESQETGLGTPQEIMGASVLADTLRADAEEAGSDLNQMLVLDKKPFFSYIIALLGIFSGVAYFMFFNKKENGKLKKFIVYWANFVVYWLNSVIHIIKNEKDPLSGIRNFSHFVDAYPSYAKEVLRYIKKAKKLGHPDYLIKYNLLNVGWPEHIVTSALSVHEEY